MYSFLSRDLPKQPPDYSEGDLYKIIDIHGHIFEIYYGYYEDCDRENPTVDPMPIYPDFLENPEYTNDGFPFVTKMQDACSHYQGRITKENDCADCRFYSHGDELIGICMCTKNRVLSDQTENMHYIKEETE